MSDYDGLEFVRFNAQGWPVVRTGKIVDVSGQLVPQEMVWFGPEDTTKARELARPTPANVTIYFIGPAGGPIKIGMASRLDFRVRELRLMNAYDLVVWASIDAPPKLERDYHKRFAAHRLHGEWFTRHPDILAEIDRLTAEQAS